MRPLFADALRPVVAVALLALPIPLRAARADAPPSAEDSARPFTIIEGEARQISAPDGAQVVCDDPAVARSDIREEKFVIIGVHAGTTLCGVRYAGIQKGLYKVTVLATAPAPPPASAPRPTPSEGKKGE